MTSRASRLVASKWGCRHYESQVVTPIQIIAFGDPLQISSAQDGYLREHGIQDCGVVMPPLVCLSTFGVFLWSAFVLLENQPPWKASLGRSCFTFQAATDVTWNFKQFFHECKRSIACCRECQQMAHPRALSMSSIRTRSGPCFLRLRLDRLVYKVFLE